VATACKASSAEHAVVRLYDTIGWQPVGQPLAGHALTVTSVAFSPDDNYILTVSRDRSWRLFERTQGEYGGYPVACNLTYRSLTLDGYVPIAANKAHARIIWDCAWAHEGDVFATAARDKLVSRELINASSVVLNDCLSLR
jgi:elongator complex protein 2